MKIIQYIELVISIVSLAVVIYGAVIAFFCFVKAELQRFKGNFNIQKLRVIRADLGTYLLLGLELLIAADILKTILEPNVTELLILGGIVLLRTLLSFFLAKEIKDIENERAQHPEDFE